MRTLTHIAAILVAGCTPSPVSSPTQAATGTSVGPVTFGMTIADIEALGFPTTLEEVRLEDDPYLLLTVEIADGQFVEALFGEGRLSDLTTSSPSLATERGARVGATLEELRSMHPEGSVNIGLADGRYFNYQVQGFGFFDFGVDDVPRSCFEFKQPCPDLGDRRSVSYRIRDLDL